MPYVAVDGTVYTASEIQDIAFSGKTIYEVIRVMKGKPLFMAEHLERLRLSGKTLQLPVEELTSDVAEGMKQVIARSGIWDNNLKIVAGYLDSGAFSWIVYPVKSFYPTPHYYQKGIKTILMQVERENPNAKVINTELSARVDELRETTDIFEGLLVDNAGCITEGSRSNVFFIEGDRLLTPQSTHVLLGITRQKLLEVAETLGIHYEEAQIEAAKAHLFDACFITGTSIGLLPVSNIDNHKMESARNQLLHKLQAGYEAVVEASLNKIDWEGSY
jgi:branched-chain amino acid aminotransferase